VSGTNATVIHAKLGPIWAKQCRVRAVREGLGTVRHARIGGAAAKGYGLAVTALDIFASLEILERLVRGSSGMSSSV
jgi:hypothetical protein